VYRHAQRTDVADAGLLSMLHLPAYLSRAVGTQRSARRRTSERAWGRIANGQFRRGSGGVRRRPEAKLVEGLS
jgi:hypothetical protein